MSPKIPQNKKYGLINYFKHAETEGKLAEAFGLSKDIQYKKCCILDGKRIMQPLLAIDIEQISVSERIQLAEDLWDSILAEPDRLPVTDTQKQVLEDRLERHKRSPGEVSSWQTVKDRLKNL